MSYGKLARGVSEEEARRRLRRVMPQGERSREFSGSSPPAVFVGSSGYPKLNTGVLSPQVPGDTGMLDSPADWYSEGLGLERIASLRTSLVNSRRKMDARQPNKLQPSREVAMASSPVDLEVSLERRPGESLRGGRAKPVSAAGELESLELAENPSVDRSVENAFYDRDMKAETALTELYGSGTDVYRLQQGMSAGLIGEEESRSLVPTRWSITATDDTVSRELRDEVKQMQQLGETRYYRGNYLGNVFHIFLVPGRWEYELLELKRSGSVWNSTDSSFVAANHEGYAGRTDYADETAGAYYAARLGVLENLRGMKRQAKALVVRDVRPDYWAPLGVWIIRETVRNSMEGHETLQSFGKLKEKLSREFTLQYPRLVNSSKMLNSRQRSLEDYR